ncbi:uncharacterized protein LOC129595476 [Paramacrobiotus metropolitanus]|uniref:uncharacterized protein LOC129595476 n=1 Tax=Paramacrobiotus metropolitanus TaxID=2943436 RepID=UPI0024456DFC|nr:uncharacterized protein LOC129595476 [Paramacrobiotus metropolitanus]XP_055348475.1 uncharacterized protein LOC129595476 [Paramacrobiotus metropolitanus]
MLICGLKSFDIHRVNQWNSVDVLTESGLFQHGEVINVAENGLIVDFHCSEQRSQLVSYDKIFTASVARCSEPYRTWRQEPDLTRLATENASVQVLWRRHPGAAWLWYPGRLLSKPMIFETIGLVIATVEVDGLGQMELFPVDQMRFPPSERQLASRALNPQSFGVRECRLPANYWSTVTSELESRFRRRIDTTRPLRIVSIGGQTVAFLQRRYGQPLTEEELKNAYEMTLGSVAQLEAPEQVYQHESGMSSLDTTRKRKYPDDDAQSETECVLPVAAHLLREIFASLDDVSCLQLRRVCPLWNEILTGADSHKTVRVSFAPNPYFSMDSPELTSVYMAVGGMLQSIDQSTERLIVEHVRGEYAEEVVRVIGRFMRGVHVQHLILHRVTFHWDDCIFRESVGSDGQLMMGVWFAGRLRFRYLSAVVEGLKGLAPYCGDLRLRQCEFSCSGRMKAIIPDAMIILDVATIETQWWNLYEAHLSRDGLHLQELAERIRTGSEEFREMVAQILMDCQTFDPRPTTRYGVRQWTVENLEDLDVSQLTTITLRALKEIPPGGA